MNVRQSLSTLNQSTAMVNFHAALNTTEWIITCSAKIFKQTFGIHSKVCPNSIQAICEMKNMQRQVTDINKKKHARDP